MNERAIVTQINSQRKYDDEMFRFDYERAVSELRRIVEAKEEKLKNIVKRFDRLILLIHTDEMLLRSDQFKGIGSAIFPHGSTTFDHVLLLFSYGP